MFPAGFIWVYRKRGDENGDKAWCLKVGGVGIFGHQRSKNSGFFPEICISIDN